MCISFSNTKNAFLWVVLQNKRKMCFLWFLVWSAVMEIVNPHAADPDIYRHLASQNNIERSGSGWLNNLACF